MLHKRLANISTEFPC